MILSINIYKLELDPLDTQGQGGKTHALLDQGCMIGGSSCQQYKATLVQKLFTPRYYLQIVTLMPFKIIFSFNIIQVIYQTRNISVNVFAGVDTMGLRKKGLFYKIDLIIFCIILMQNIQFLQLNLIFIHQKNIIPQSTNPMCIRD